MLERRMFKWAVLAIVLIVLVLGGLAWWTQKENSSPYTAVYLRTGDIYIGRLTWFPRPSLTEVWYIQRGVDNQNQPQLGLAPFKGVFWGPSETLNLNPDEIIWWAKLRTDSQVAQALANPNQLNPQGSGAQNPGAAPGGQ